MPVQILKAIRARQSISKVGILGMTFKSGSDDTRYSLSFKLKKLLMGAGYSVVCADPWVPKFSDMSVLHGCDCLVLMTPHAEFADLSSILERVDNEKCVFVDMWGFWKIMRGRSESVHFLAKEALQALAAV